MSSADQAEGRLRSAALLINGIQDLFRINGKTNRLPQVEIIERRSRAIHAKIIGVQAFDGGDEIPFRPVSSVP